MSDSYPVNLTIEIDRPLLRRYLRVKWFLLLAAFPLLFGFIGFLSYMERIPYEVMLKGETILFVLRVLAISFGSSCLATVVLYFLFGHRLAARYAESLAVTVEGPFLRIREHGALLIDRKIHFRSIHDYSTVQGRLLRRFGMYALYFTTTGVRAPGYGVNMIVGIKDCEKVRDMLADIDRLRENA